jgi:DNA topoisomerase-1
VQLLERTLIRVGNEEYARDNGSVGLTTMKDGHAIITGGTVTFQFRGKSGIRHAIDLHDPRLARIVKACRDLPGYELFQYQAADGTRRSIGSGDVNAHLRQISGEDFTAKDFRTWAGTVMAATELARQPAFRSATQAKRNVVAAIDAVARRLGNTKAVARKCYIHPAVLEAYMDGHVISVARPRGPRGATLSHEERAVVQLLASRLRKAA